MMTKAAINTINQTAVKTFAAGMPQTIGMVLQPYLASPSISSISFITSLIKEMIKAKAAYKMASLNNLLISKGKRRTCHPGTTEVGKEARVHKEN